VFGFAALASGLAVRSDRGLAPLDALLAQPMQHGVQVLLPDWDDWTDAVIAALPEYAGPWRSEQEVTFLPPVTHSPTVYCAGANYRDHVAEMGRAQSQAEPYHFLVPPAALAGHRDTATRPPGMQRLDWRRSSSR
jgi:2-keto-4-pentenoate hydratase/2-oxohepta-3-ene-1,7-dioic acid hydratase in catechol pathway